MNAELQKFLKEFDVSIDGIIIEKGRKLFLVPQQVALLLEQKKIEPFCAGLPLGELTQNSFQPSLALLDMMTTTHRFVTITDEGEWLFVCGRDVFEENVKDRGDTSGRFLVMNTRKEVLGLGRWKKDAKNRYVTPLLDRGDFLRREEKKKKRG